MFKILFLFLFLPKLLFAQYDFYQDPQKFQANFQGDIIMESSMFNYYLTNTHFSFDYAFLPEDSTLSGDQQIFKWFFSKLYNHNTPKIFEILWDHNLNNISKELAYTVRLESGEFKAFNKQGKNLEFGNFLSILFPVVDLQRNRYENGERLAITKDNNQKYFLIFETEGLDYKLFRSQDDKPIPLLETNESFINQLNKEISTSDHIHWLQFLRVREITATGKDKSSISTAGVYAIQKKQHAFVNGKILIEANILLNYQMFNFSVPVTVKLSGVINTTKK